MERQSEQQKNDHDELKSGNSSDKAFPQLSERQMDQTYREKAKRIEDPRSDDERQAARKPEERLQVDPSLPEPPVESGSEIPY